VLKYRALAAGIKKRRKSGAGGTPNCPSTAAAASLFLPPFSPFSVSFSFSSTGTAAAPTLVKKTATNGGRSKESTNKIGPLVNLSTSSIASGTVIGNVHNHAIGNEINTAGMILRAFVVLKFWLVSTIAIESPNPMAM
jgi:hypothetical protein